MRERETAALSGDILCEGFVKTIHEQPSINQFSFHTSAFSCTCDGRNTRMSVKSTARMLQLLGLIMCLYRECRSYFILLWLRRPKVKDLRDMGFS